MSKKITIDRDELLRLRLEGLFVRHAARRGLHLEAAPDFARRAIEAKRFQLDDNGQLAGAVDFEATAFLDSLEADPAHHGHLFQKVEREAPVEEKDADVSKLTARQKLALANERKFAEMRR